MWVIGWSYVKGCENSFIDRWDMEQKQINISFEEYGHLQELAKIDQKLVTIALEAAKKAYAPYSGFRVGAALLLENGEIVQGSNQENAAYPSGMCAERVALYWAGANFPDVAITSLAVVAMKNGQMVDEVAAPCGACRQVIVESQYRSGNSFPIILAGKNKTLKVADGNDLLPLAFGPWDLK